MVCLVACLHIQGWIFIRSAVPRRSGVVQDKLKAHQRATVGDMICHKPTELLCFISTQSLLHHVAPLSTLHCIKCIFFKKCAAKTIFSLDLLVFTENYNSLMHSKINV